MAGLGGFRGVVAEVLWFRAHRLQEAGRYLELVQLADWLTMLDPHASEAWVYNAWNLAYNVSVMMARPEDRLRWVQNGIALLRDDGLRFNPREARLYRELAWFYQNKVGDALDTAHLAYKFHLAGQLAPCVNADGTLRDTPESRARLAGLRPDRLAPGPFARALLGDPGPRTRHRPRTPDVPPRRLPAAAPQRFYRTLLRRSRRAKLADRSEPRAGLACGRFPGRNVPRVSVRQYADRRPALPDTRHT